MGNTTVLRQGSLTYTVIDTHVEDGINHDLFVFLDNTPIAKAMLSLSKNRYFIQYTDGRTGYTPTYNRPMHPHDLAGIIINETTHVR